MSPPLKCTQAEVGATERLTSGEVCRISQTCVAMGMSVLSVDSAYCFYKESQPFVSRAGIAFFSLFHLGCNSEEEVVSACGKLWIPAYSDKQIC